MNIDFSQLPKALADSVSINFNQHHFLVAITSGQSVSAFGMPPELIKAFAKGLDDKLKEYESKFGTIDMAGAEAGIQSPIQIT
ncbi:MAG: hypothetical protein AAB472_02380 [Patescibacteria group bacterium]